MAVNLKSAFLMAQAVAREMVNRGSGSIIHTASIASFIGRNNIAAYSASNAGVVLMRKVMPMDLAEYGIRVSTISAGHDPYALHGFLP
jgi:NAD(P)-dependent dehydrogenase (short-subunit alcohol dehydrogenase family)